MVFPFILCAPANPEVVVSNIDLENDYRNQVMEEELIYNVYQISHEGTTNATNLFIELNDSGID